MSSHKAKMIIQRYPIYIKTQTSHTKSFNIIVSIVLTTIAHMLNWYDIIMS